MNDPYTDFTIPFTDEVGVELRRVPRDEYYMEIARATARRSSCRRRQVGAVLVVGDSVASTGYNGTPRGALNCAEGGCPRCAGDAPPGAAYDACLCVHAEANAILLAARRGTATEGGAIYSTLRPCLGCRKAMIQAGIRAVTYEGYLAFPTQEQEALRELDDLIDVRRS